MKRNSFTRRLMSLVLSLVMVISLANGLSAKNVRAEEDGVNGRVTWEKVENNGKGLLFQSKDSLKAFEDNYVHEGMVRASIILEAPSTMAKGYKVDHIASNSEAKNYRVSLKEQQDAVAAKISADILGGEKLDVVWNITLAGNIISANVPYDKIESIRNMIGVRDVVIETQYEPAVVSKDSNDPNMATGNEMVGSNYVWASGYTGKGSVIAVVDTGLDLDHELFDPAAFEYALSESEEETDLMGAEDVAAVFDQLNISPDLRTADGIYRNSKVPYAVNYVDRDLDVSHLNDTEGEHGSHVSGIAAANRYVADGNDFVPALEKVKTQGEAPDAQLMVMKVFGRNGGAYDSDYMVAIEDAIVLGADSVNLSLGSSVAGFVTNSTYSGILNEVSQAANLVWTNSAGNNSNWAGNLGYYLYEDDVNFATGGSPATYPVTLSVASVDNKGRSGMYFVVDDTKYVYTETYGYGNTPMNKIAGEYEYILLDGPGVDDNGHVGTEGDDFLKLGSELVEGKIAMCYRGTSSFFAKVNAAAAQGAAGVVIINNQAGSISMNLTGTAYNIPAVSITQADGAAIKAASEPVTNEEGEVIAYTGSMTITNQAVVENPGEVDCYNMSSFSSWGVPGDLSLKPEITAPGGNIYSVFGLNKVEVKNASGAVIGYTTTGGHDQYENMSGTSMASPQMAGLAAVFSQYIRENGLTEKTGRTQRQLTLSMLMSTAEPMTDAYGELYPVIQQGAGLANVNNAVNARSFLTIDDTAAAAPAFAAASIADGKVKVELGEVKADSFTASFSIHNFSEEDQSYYLSADFFTQLITEGLRTTWIDPVDLALSWTVNGTPFQPADASHYDFNGDGVANGKDALYLLDYCAGLVEELNDQEYADLDTDGDIDTADARLAFEMLNGASLDIAAGETASIVLTVSGLDAAFGGFPNGNYIEGYIYAQEGETEDGALGIRHSIPVLGFYGNWTDASMFDKGSAIEYYFGLLDAEAVQPYMVQASVLGLANVGLYSQGYIVNGNLFTGNPVAGDASLADPETALYLPERNALGSASVVDGIQFSQIRNAGASRFFVTDQYGKIVPGTEMLGGSLYAAYYYPAQSSWQTALNSTGFGYMPRNLKENKSYTLNYQLAPEYYINEDGSVRWDELGEGASFTLPFVYDNTAPYIVTATYDEEANSLSVTAHDNQYIAAAAVYTEAGDLVSYYGGIADFIRGEQATYPFDLSKFVTGEETDPVHFLVEVYDYAANLSTYKVNLNPEEANDPYSVVLDTHEGTIVNKGTLKLNATVYPWGFADDTVTWTSSDESLATVDENGLVTSVASEEGTVIITATSAADPEASDSCKVDIVILHKDLNGIVWDENGEVWPAAFDVADIPEYEKLTDTSLRPRLTSMAYDEEGTLYGLTLSKFNGTETLYTVDPETWELTEVGAAALTYADICQAPSLGDNHLLGVYGPYAVIINKTTGAYEGVFNLSEYTGGKYLVGIAYEEQYDHPTYGNTDWVFLLDEAGNVYETGFLPYGESYQRFKVSKIGQIGAAVDTPYWQSLYFDGESLYWSRFNEADNKVELIMVYDLFNDGSVFSLGSFADNVWPVGGLFELGVNPFFGKLSDGAEDHSDAVIDEDAVMETEIEPLELGKAPEKAAGSLNEVIERAPEKGSAAEPQKISTDVTVDIAAEKLTNNGLITVEVPETAELVSWNSAAQYQAWNDKEAGMYRFAFVDLEGIEEKDSILTLKFSKDSIGTVTITTADINEDDEAGQVETVVLGPATHTIHTYGEPVWNWSDDHLTAEVTFTCELGDDTQVLQADVTSEVGAGVITYTGTVEFEGKTYTDTVEVELPAAKVQGASASFAGEIKSNLYVYVRDDVLADEEAYAEVVFNDEITKFMLKDITDRTTVNDLPCLRFQIPVKAKELKDYALLRICTGDGEAVQLINQNNEDVTESGAQYSVQDYLTRMQENSDKPKMVKLAKAAEDYGTAAQLYFEYNAEDLVIPENVTAVTPEDMAAYAPVEEGTLPAGITKIANSVLFQADNTLRTYYMYEAGTDISKYTFTVDGAEAEVTDDAAKKRCYIDVPAIAAKNLGDVHTFTVSDGAATHTYKISADGYAYKMVNTSKNPAMVDLAKALYLYNLAAVEYFSN